MNHTKMTTGQDHDEFLDMMGNYEDSFDACKPPEDPGSAALGYSAMEV